MTKERIEKLLKAGANVVLTTKGIDDMALKVSLSYTSLLICNDLFGFFTQVILDKLWIFVLGAIGTMFIHVYTIP